MGRLPLWIELNQSFHAKQDRPGRLGGQGKRTPTGRTHPAPGGGSGAAGDVRVELGSGNPKQGTWAEHGVQIEDVVAVLHTERTLKLKRGVFAGERHRGGMPFDVLK